MKEYITQEELELVAKKAVDRAIKKARKEANRIIAELTMPSVGSWNGKWTLEGETHTIVVNDDRALGLIGNYHYDFGDGWVANVEFRKAKPKEKVSNRFCGYEWMVKRILESGKIER